MATATATATRKIELRRNLRRARRALSPAQQHQHAQQLLHNTLQTLLTLRFRSFALYLPADGEIDTMPLINKLLSFDLAVGLPRLRKTPTGHWRMHFARFSVNTPLTVGAYDLLEPASTARSNTPLVPDVLLMPLVGYDDDGHRLGMGGGFYDRYTNPLERARPALRIGLAHDLQRLPQQQLLPTDPWDKPLDGVITETGVQGFSARGTHCLL